VVEVWVVADDLKDIILSIFEASLHAQLRAIRRLRQAPEAAQAARPKRMSQVDMASTYSHAHALRCMSR
jgi:hypothetical protein